MHDYFRQWFFDPDVESGVSLRRAIPDQLADSSVRIKVSAAGLNRADVKRIDSVRRVHSPLPPAQPGLEVSGTVLETGAAVTRWAVGDPVVALTSGNGFAELVDVDERLVLRQPAGLSSHEAAGVIEVASTFWAAYGFGKNRVPSSVLIHGGTSGLGMFGTQLAKAHGSFVGTTCGDEDKTHRSRVLGADFSVNYRAEAFEDAFRHVGTSFDLIIDPIGGAYIARDVTILNQGGTIASLGSFDASVCSIDLGELALKQVTLRVTSLGALPVGPKSEIVRDVGLRVWPLLEQGKIDANISAMYSFGDLEQALADLRSGETWGKLIIAMD